MKLRTHAAIAAVVAVMIGGLVFVFVQVGGGSGSGVRVGSREAVACADDGPDCLPAVPFVDRAGKMWDHEELVGKVVVLNVWATWCKPCRAEMPELVSLRAKYDRDEVIFLGVLKDNASDTAVDRFIRQYQVNYPIVPMNSELEVALDYPSALPTTFIYDRSGFLGRKIVGAVTLSGLSSAIDSALAANH